MQKYFDDRLCSGHFRMTMTRFQILCNKISPLVSQVMLSHSAKSHDVFEHSCGICSLNAFPFSIICIKPFHTSQKLPQVSVTF